MQKCFSCFNYNKGFYADFVKVHRKQTSRYFYLQAPGSNLFALFTRQTPTRIGEQRYIYSPRKRYRQIWRKPCAILRFLLHSVALLHDNSTGIDPLFTGILFTVFNVLPTFASSLLRSGHDLQCDRIHRIYTHALRVITLVFCFHTLNMFSMTRTTDPLQ